MKKEKKQKEMGFFPLLRATLPRVFRAAPAALVVTCLLAVVHGVSQALSAPVQQRLIDGVTGAVGGGGFPLGALLLFCFFQLWVILINAGHNLFTSVFLFERGCIRLRKTMHRKAAGLDPLAFERKEQLDDIEKAENGVWTAVYFVFTSFNLLTFYLPYFIVMGWYLFSLKPVLALGIVFVFLPVALTQLLKSRFFSKLEDQLAPLRRERDHYDKCISSREFFKETRLLGATHFFRTLYDTAQLLFFRKEWKTKGRAQLFELGANFLTLCGYFGILYLLFGALLAGEISVGAFAAVFNSIGMLFSIMEEIVSDHIGSISEQFGTVRNFVRFMQMPERAGGTEKPETFGLSLRNVSFTYPGKETPALSDVSLDIRAGETVAVVGVNGAGKSTLVRVLSGLYRPDSGEAMIGGVPTDKIAPEELYRNTSAVFQKFQKYLLTLGENISVGAGELNSADAGRLETAAEQAGVEADGESYPDGFATLLGREFDGAEVSGGQWQRIAIARGLYRPHEIIFLDEPTAAIDPIEETRLYRRFAEISKGKTSVLVTHRLGSARIADRIIVMAEGKIAETGTHDELMAAGGLYAEMFSSQAKWYAAEAAAEPV